MGTKRAFALRGRQRNEETHSEERHVDWATRIDGGPILEKEKEERQKLGKARANRWRIGVAIWYGLRVGFRLSFPFPSSFAWPDSNLTIGCSILFIFQHFTTPTI